MEYYNLSQAFGKATSTQTAVKPGDTANSHLIARYFTSNNAGRMCPATATILARITAPPSTKVM